MAALPLSSDFKVQTRKFYIGSVQKSSQGQCQQVLYVETNSLMAKCYFGEGEDAMERLVEEFKEALREEGITTPGTALAFCSSI